MICTSASSDAPKVDLRPWRAGCHLLPYSFGQRDSSRIVGTGHQQPYRSSGCGLPGNRRRDFSALPQLLR